MLSQKETPFFITLGSWLLSFFVFAVGFWHTHLGLKDLRPFNSEYGSIIISAIVLLALLLSYWYAVNGKKNALILYLLCSLFFFLFNLNYFYPSYLSRQLVKEEAISLNDTLQKYSGKSSSYFKSETLSQLSDLYDLKSKVLFEIKKDGGLGPDAKDYLSRINAITSSAGGQTEPIKLNGSLGSNQFEREQISLNYDTLINSQIQNFVIKKMANNRVGNPVLIYEGTRELNALKDKYTDSLKIIITDDREIILDSLITLRQGGKNLSQIQTLQNLVTDIDNATKKINEGYKEQIYPVLKEASTRNLGRIAHTLKSIKQRTLQTDTLIILLLCLFIDLIVPLGMYFLLQKSSNLTITRKHKTPIDFNKN